MSAGPQTPAQRPLSFHRSSSSRSAFSHHWHPSSLDMSYNSPSRRHSINRRSSDYSFLTPRSSRDFDQDQSALSLEGGGGGGGEGGGSGNGLGNLADELGDWDEDEEEGLEGGFGEEVDGTEDDLSTIGTAMEHDGSSGLDKAASFLHGVRDSGVDMHSPSSSSSAQRASEARARLKRRGRKQAMYGDDDDGGGSDDGEAASAGDWENEGISPALESRMAAVESLAQRGVEENGSASDLVVKRVTEQLRELGSQVAIETGATRLKTTHDALAAHLTHQSRTLASLASSFSGPRPMLPDAESVDMLLPLIQSTLEQLPYSSNEPLVSLSRLTLSTRELLQHLAHVSDTLHMSRQTTANAGRRLKVSKEQLQDWKREHEKTEQGRTFIEQGDWDRRLREREAKTTCASVLDGFEDVCGIWRSRLCEGLGVASG